LVARESKRRSVVKTIAWRLIATLNSFLVLLSGIGTGPLTAAILMNITGFIVYYLFERACNKITWGIQNDPS